MADENYTYGIELELGNIDLTKAIPEGWTTSGDPDVMNLNPHIACDPEQKYCLMGRELNSRPCTSIEDITELCKAVFEYYPEATKCHKTVTHAHISWPGINENLEELKNMLKYNIDSCEWIIAHNMNYDMSDPRMNTLARQFLNFDRCRMPDWRYEFCKNATTVEEFKKGHSRVSDGRYLPQTTRRYYINMYPIFKPQKTIEFRAFFPTIDYNEVNGIFKFVRQYTEYARMPEGKRPRIEEWGDEFVAALPKESKYDHEVEMAWQLTNYKFNTPEVASKNAEYIINGGSVFDLINK